MNETQFFITIAMAPVMSLVIVLAGYIVQNANLNARIAEVRTDSKEILRAELTAVRSEMAALRSEMAKNHSELLTALAQHELQLDRNSVGRSLLGNVDDCIKGSHLP